MRVGGVIECIYGVRVLAVFPVFLGIFRLFACRSTFDSQCKVRSAHKNTEIHPFRAYHRCALNNSVAHCYSFRLFSQRETIFCMDEKWLFLCYSCEWQAKCIENCRSLPLPACMRRYDVRCTFPWLFQLRAHRSKVTAHSSQLTVQPSFSPPPILKPWSDRFKLSRWIATKQPSTQIKLKQIAQK